MSYDKNNPYFSSITERTLLSRPGSSKRTYHLALKNPSLTLFHKPGDAVSVLPSNARSLVEEILAITGNPYITDPRSSLSLLFGDYLRSRANLERVTPGLLKALELDHLLDPAKKEERLSFCDEHSLLSILRIYGNVPAQTLADSLSPLLPRFYSIASSGKRYPDEIHLLVGYIHYMKGNEEKSGIASHFLCEEARLEEDPIPIYLQPTPHFTLPLDPTTPIIMIGPGTGIAPYRAFLHEREESSGKNWLFFGERNQAFDFFYGDYLRALERTGKLRLDTAFSRDQAQKIYVQHRLIEQGKELWDWIKEGAYIYVCGDASRMAKAVHEALEQIIMKHGSYSAEGAHEFLHQMRKQKRYLADVY